MRLLLSALLIMTSLGLAAQPLPYRLAGISYSEGGPSWAVIELADGSQRLLREGKSFDTASTLEQVREQDVDLIVDGQRYTLRLDRGDAEYQDPPQLASSTVVRNWDELQFALRSAARNTKLTRQQLNGLFGLPDSVEINEVNHIAAANAAEAVKLLTADNGDEYIRLGWQGSDGPAQMYVLPAEPEPTTN